MKTHPILTLLSVSLLLLTINANSQDEATTGSTKISGAAEKSENNSLKSTLDSLLAELEKISDDSNDSEDASRTSMAVTSLRKSVENSDLGDVNQLQSLSQYTNTVSSIFPQLNVQFTEVQQLIKQRIDTIAENEAKELEATFEELGTVLLSAEDPEELDVWIKRLADLTGSNVRYSSYGQTTNDDLRRLTGYLSNASQTVVYWQDYLMNRKLQNVQECKRSLSSLSSQVTRFPYVPRSKVLKLQAQMDTPNPFGGKQESIEQPTSDTFVEELTSIQSALDLHHELGEMGTSRLRELDVYGLYTNLGKFKNGYSMMMQGAYSSGASSLRPLLGMRKLGSLANELLIDGYSQSLSIPDDFKPKEKETLEEFIDRYLKSISSDHKTLWQAIKASAEFLPSGSKRTMLYDETKALDDLFAAQSYEAQKEYARAITAYREFLTAVTIYSPTEDIEKHLLKLKKDHPKAAETAEQMTSHRSIPRTYHSRHLPSSMKDFIRTEIAEQLREQKASSKTTKSDGE